RDEDAARARAGRGDTHDEACGRDDPVVRAEDGGAQPADALRAVSFDVSSHGVPSPPCVVVDLKTLMRAPARARRSPRARGAPPPRPPRKAVPAAGAARRPRSPAARARP